MRDSAPAAVPGDAGQPTATLLAIDALEWEAVLRSARHDFYHLPGYVDLCAAQEGGRPAAIYVEQGTRQMLLPLVTRPVADGRHDAASPYGYPGPVGSGTDDIAFLRSAFESGFRLLADAGIVSAFVRFHPLLDTVPPDVPGILVDHGETVSVDLDLPEEALWAQVRQNHRRDIRRAQRLGYVVSMDDEWRHLDRFEEMYLETMTRRSAAAYYHFDHEYFADLRLALGSRLHLCVVQRAGVVVSAGLFVETDGIVQYHLSGTEAAHLGAQPLKLMIHFVIGWAKARGDHRLHLGGGVGGTDDSLFHFKAGFSPLRHRYRTLRTVLDAPEYRRLTAMMAPAADPDDLRGFFPAYRANP